MFYQLIFLFEKYMLKLCTQENKSLSNRRKIGDVVEVPRGEKNPLYRLLSKKSLYGS